MGLGLLSEFIEKSYIPYEREHQRGWQSDVRCLRRHVLPYLGAYPLSAVTADTLYRWREELPTSGLSRSTCYRLFWLMKYVLNCAVRRQRLVDDAAFCDPACPRGAQRCPETLSHEEILRTVSLLRQHESNASADAVRLFFSDRNSESEICYDRWEDVVFSRSVPVTRRAPSGEVRDIPLSEDGGGVFSVRCRSAPMFRGCCFGSPLFLQACTPVLAAGGMPPFPSRPPRSRKRVFPGDAFVRAVSAGREKFGRKQPCPAVPGVSS